MAKAAFGGLMASLKAGKYGGMVHSVSELHDNQFGIPLQHYVQWYLFGANALRLHVFHSIAGVPASCKSPLLFDLLMHNAEPKEDGGLGGFSVLFELEEKISPDMLQSMMLQHSPATEENFMPLNPATLEDAMEIFSKEILPGYKANYKDNSVPLMVGFDSIGGAAMRDTTESIQKEGAIGKGFYDKPHVMKYFCENSKALFGNIPVVIIAINQEKESTAQSYGPPQKKITGGASQVFKDGHMISATAKELASKDGKVVTLRTTKTSFSDSRKIEVLFRWNKYGAEGPDKLNMHFDWQLAAANHLADPDKGVGDIRDICDVKVSDKNLVTCPQLDLRSVPQEEFEAALMANTKVLNALCTYEKISQIKGIDEYAAHLKGDTRKQVDMSTEKQPAKRAKPQSKPLTDEMVAKALNTMCVLEDGNEPEG